MNSANEISFQEVLSAVADMMQYWFLLITINLVSCVSSRDESILRYFDLTNDGVVDKRELRRIAYSDYKIAPEFSDSIFRRVDKNGDNELNETEIEAGKTLIEANAKQMTEQWLKEHDVDNNGKLSQFELMQGEYMEHGHSFGVIRKHFEESDINGDLFLDSEELMHVRRLLRSLALKDASELMKRYDSDNDHFLSLREAQILADEVFDLGPEITSSILETVDFRKQQKINELELVDFLSELRAEAATEALDKLTILDENGNGMISFDELLDRYGEDLKKSVLKKIFFRVDLNKKHKDAVLPNQPNKPHRVITVQRAPSPELEALLLAGKQQNEKADYHYRSQPKRTRLARQAGTESTNGTKQNDDEPKSDSDEYKDFSVVPFQEPNSDTSPLQGPNNDTSLLQGPNNDTSLLQGPNNDTSLLQGPNNDTIVRRKAKKNPAQKKSRNFIDELRTDLYKILGGVNKKNAKLIGVVNDSLKALGSDYRIGDDVNMNDNSTASTDPASSIDKDKLKNDEGTNTN
ncbi:unnamed protein product [Anisakis simplex]|uniref:EF-hand domain-containing protein n=1 Tax=Anisakis simplex TaxID=6269 RepID=A0A0M3JYL3_ANISI|nr:unnamed protein product [Anisakis simplex]